MPLFLLSFVFFFANSFQFLHTGPRERLDNSDKVSNIFFSIEISTEPSIHTFFGVVNFLRTHLDAHTEAVAAPALHWTCFPRKPHIIDDWPATMLYLFSKEVTQICVN